MIQKKSKYNITNNLNKMEYADRQRLLQDNTTGLTYANVTGGIGFGRNDAFIVNSSSVVPNSYYKTEITGLSTVKKLGGEFQMLLRPEQKEENHEFVATGVFLGLNVNSLTSHTFGEQNILTGVYEKPRYNSTSVNTAKGEVPISHTAVDTVLTVKFGNEKSMIFLGGGYNLSSVAVAGGSAIDQTLNSGDRLNGGEDLQGFSASPVFVLGGDWNKWFEDNKYISVGCMVANGNRSTTLEGSVGIGKVTKGGLDVSLNLTGVLYGGSFDNSHLVNNNNSLITSLTVGFDGSGAKESKIRF